MGCVPSRDAADREANRSPASNDRSQQYAVDSTDPPRAVASPIVLADEPVSKPVVATTAAAAASPTVKTTVVHAVSSGPPTPSTPSQQRMAEPQSMRVSYGEGLAAATQSAQVAATPQSTYSPYQQPPPTNATQALRQSQQSTPYLQYQQQQIAQAAAQQQPQVQQPLSHFQYNSSVQPMRQSQTSVRSSHQSYQPPQPAPEPAVAYVGQEEDDPDWDQCSTQFDLEAEPQAGGPAVSPVANGNSLLSAYQQEEPPMEFTETAVLRIDRLRGCTFINQYLVVKFLGRGACGKVFLCLNTHDLRLYAMKVVKKTDLEATTQNNNAKKKQRSPVEDLKREIAIMKTMNHPNIVTLSEVIDDPKGNKLLLVMEYMDGGPVLTREALEKRDCLPESLCRQYFRDMLKALDYLHCHKVVHGDLKPENVLMSGGGEVKLSDFGCSKVFVTGNEYLDRCNGTPAFLAPEMMKPHTRYRGRPSDVYALGACLYTLVYGRIPFTAPNLLKLFQVVQNDPVRYHEDVPISKQLRDLMEGLLCKEPSKRLTLQDAMRHPWVSMHGRFPLKSFRELQEGECQDQHDGVVGHETFAEANPQVDLLKRFSTMGDQDEVFNPGEYLIKQGEQGSFALYIVSGVVDILVRTPQQRSPGGDDGMADGDKDEKMSDYAARLRDLADRAAEKAQDLINNLQARGGPDKKYLLVAQRGAGDLVGEMAMLSKDGVRCATVRCASRVVVRILRMEAMLDYIREQPHVRHQLRELLWRRNNESTMVEALYRLAQVREDGPLVK